MTGKSLSISTPDGSFGAYVAEPKSTPAAAVIAIQDIFGVNGTMREVCDRLAEAGYLAVAPDLFWRIEPGVDITDQSEAEWKKAFALMNAFDVDKGVQDIAATIAAVRANPRCNGKVGAVGYCLGGRLAYLTATRTDVDATVGYYGVGIDTYLPEAERLSRPLMLHIAEEDGFVNKEAQERIVAALKDHPQVKLHSYPGRDHAFARPGGAHYHAGDAETANRRTLAFFKEHVELPDPVAGEGQVVVRHEAVGLNFIDTYQRSGLYPGTFPRILGNEAAGVVESIGHGVTRLKVGDRVAYTNQPGGYSEKNAVIASRVVKLPDGVSTRIAAAAMLKGMTARFLSRIWPLSAGDTVLVHAAAGGVGGILTQWLTHKGIKVIGTAGTPEKAAIAKGHGCVEVILYRDEDVAERVKALTGGTGAKVVYDSVGKATFDASLASVAKQQLLVSFGNASGPVPPLDILRLMRGGSIFLTRPTLFDYVATTEMLDEASAELFEMIASDAVKIDIGQEWPLKDVRKAHKALEGRETVGATLLIP